MKESTAQDFAASQWEAVLLAGNETAEEVTEDVSADHGDVQR